MKKVVAMIPARMGSKRIKKKNIRLLNGVPLISYVIRAAKDSGVFDEIYINSESQILARIADTEGVKFYHRPSYLSSDEATNDDFALDFMQNVQCETLIQILPTSPFITKEEIISFVETAYRQELDTAISVCDQKIECIFENKPINFVQKDKTPPSQLLEPVKSYACSLMGWKTENFIQNMNKYNSAYHGGDGNIGFFTLKGFSTIDIDNEEDFQLAEMVAKTLTNKVSFEKRYYGEEHIEVDVPQILKKDGVKTNNLFEANKSIVDMSQIIEENDSTRSWSHRLIDTENNSATLIHQLPGEGNRRHYHPDWNEWWYIVDGEWEWEIDGVTKQVRKHDVVFIPKGIVHKIKASGDQPAIRLAVSRSDVQHVYPNGDLRED